jgi:dipeptidyl aminopeptidase/acylaminoacyl peptidase
MNRTLLILLTLPFLSTPIFGAQGENDVLVPGDNLVVEGIPKIPAALAEELNRYSEIRSATLASWHPTNREMLINTRFADTPQIHQVSFPGGARTQLTFFKDRSFGATYHPVKGDYFVFSKDIGGNENFQMFRFDLATAAVTLLTDGKSRNTGGIWSYSGDKFVYGSTRRNGRDVDIWMMDPAIPKSDRQLVQLEGGGWSAVDFSPDDRTVLLAEYISANESYLWLLDMATGERTLFTPKGGAEKVFYGDARFSRDGRGIYVITDRDSEFQRLAFVELKDRQYRFLTDHLKSDLDRFDLSWDGRTLAFIANEQGRGVLHLMDTASGKEQAVPKLPAGSFSSLSWHKNNRDLGIAYESVRKPSDVYSLDVTTGKVERWTRSETAGIDTESTVEAELVRWPSFDGKSISGWMRRPPAKFTGPRPVIILIHGGPEGQARPIFRAEMNYLVNELGVVVIEPNVRGSTGFGKTWLKLDNGFLREDSYKDIGALFDWIGTRPELDRERIMVTGGSYGGHMTLAMATRFPNRIRCALDIVGIGNLVTFLENTSAYRRDLRRVEYGDERDPKMREFLERIAPLNNATNITKPLFVVQGGNDPRVPLSESVQMVRTARGNGTPVWYLMAKDEGHGFVKKKNRDFLFCATVAFVKEYLLR